MSRKKNYTLVGVDGNAYSVMGYVIRAMRECGRPVEEIKAYQTSAMSSDYNNLICVSCEKLEELNKER